MIEMLEGNGTRDLVAMAATLYKTTSGLKIQNITKLI